MNSIVKGSVCIKDPDATVIDYCKFIKGKFQGNIPGDFSRFIYGCESIKGWIYSINQINMALA